MDRKDFLDPPTSCRGVTLFMLNDRLDGDEIERQLRGFRDAGWGAVITRTFDGLATEYLGEEWFAVLDRIVRVARELGMKVWFQAGYMPNGVPELPEELEAKVLVARPRAEAGEEGDRALAEDDEHVYVARRLRHVLDLLSPDAVRSYLRQAYEQTYVERFGDELGRTIEAVWVDEPSFQPPRLPWSDRLEALYPQRWGKPIGPAIASLFRRVGDFRRARHRYWRTVVEMFASGYFREVAAWCEAHGLKFTGHLMGEDTLCSQIAWTGSTMPAYEHMGIPGIDHLTRSLRWSHGATEALKRSPVFLLTPKQCSSVANQHGKPAALAEMYGVSSQGLTFEDRKGIGDWFALLGINYRCLHGSFYSLRGRRKRIYPPHLSHQQPWWADNRLPADYFARLSYAMRQGRFCADVLIVHPIESAFCIYEPLRYEFSRPDRTPDDIARMNDALAALSDNLMKAHRSFEYADEGILARLGEAAADGLRVGEMTYRAVILPPLITLRRSTIDLLTRFLDGGGTVLSAGELPSRVDGAEDAAVEAFCARLTPVANEPEALAAALAGPATPRAEVLGIEGPAENVWLHERQIDGGRILFLANTSRTERAEVELHVRPAGRLEEWDLVTGEVRPACRRVEGDAVVAALAFPPAASHLLVLKEGGAPVEVAAPRRETVRTIPLDGPWRVRRHGPNALTLDRCRLRRGRGECTPPMPVIAAQELLTEEGYRGPVTLQFRFECRFRPGRLGVVVEQADACRITLNGRPAGSRWAAPYLDEALGPIDVAEAAREGDNVVEVARDFQPLPQPDFDHGGRFQNLPGVELESIYLLGDFAVGGAPSARPARPRCVRQRPGFVLAAEPDTTGGDLVADGYPFYAGSVTLGRRVAMDAPAEGERAILVLPALHACVAKVSVNGAAAGAIAWPPYEADLTPHLRAGDNEIEIELTNTLRNLLGPHHRPSGEPDDVWGENAFSGRWSAATRRSHPRWWEHREEDTDAWTDDYFFVPFGLAEGTEIRLVRGGATRP